eukprot:6219283-Amphidinium_carterae.1
MGGRLCCSDRECGGTLPQAADLECSNAEVSACFELFLKRLAALISVRVFVIANLLWAGVLGVGSQTP